MSLQQAGLKNELQKVSNSLDKRLNFQWQSLMVSFFVFAALKVIQTFFCPCISWSYIDKVEISFLKTPAYFDLGGKLKL